MAGQGTVGLRKGDKVITPLGRGQVSSFRQVKFTDKKGNTLRGRPVNIARVRVYSEGMQEFRLNEIEKVEANS